ncbi:hypothetical protein SCHPADRAFT_943663 [Schizopora paradoxa]|uniref:Uncharacterized protein n=1 Tax=Schizopora paradoxa TaxID=27342 RepID=A0A0H2RD54_9AGAM|nr:hypothetical protein SCHPADRAFT_943663 [Schizopora paradoxa]
METFNSTGHIPILAGTNDVSGEREHISFASIWPYSPTRLSGHWANDSVHHIAFQTITDGMRFSNLRNPPHPELEKQSVQHYVLALRYDPEDLEACFSSSAGEGHDETGPFLWRPVESERVSEAVNTPEYMQQQANSLRKYAGTVEYLEAFANQMDKHTCLSHYEALLRIINESKVLLGLANQNKSESSRRKSGGILLSGSSIHIVKY